MSELPKPTHVYKLPNNIVAESIRGIEYYYDIFLEPIQDADGNWVVAQDTVDAINLDVFNLQLQLNLELIPYNPVIPEDDGL